MSKYRKLETLTAMKETGIVPVFFNSNVEIAQNVVKACYEGGIRAFEFTNRGDFAIEVFKELSKFVLAECPGLILGAGTILDTPTAALYIQMGANFIVSPSLNPEVARLCNRHRIPYTPGCGSVTEICNAQELGCDLVKDVLAPLPWSMIMATGSVEPTEENLSAWAKSGVTCVGMGSKLFPKEMIAAGEWSKITDLCRSALKFFK